jgi:TolB-like protein
MESRDALPFTGGGMASRSLAVLPLQNLSGDAQQEWFADGVTEELTSALSQVSALRVVSGISARHYKGSDKTATQIARERGDVQLLLGGSVRRDDDRLRVSVFLDEVGSDRRIWTRSYERGLGQGPGPVQRRGAERRVADRSCTDPRRGDAPRDGARREAGRLPGVPAGACVPGPNSWMAGASRQNLISCRRSHSTRISPNPTRRSRSAMAATG